ncbi:MAG: hypothetical protein KAR40_08025 [Candidatus Sabulitectum sp.]|nr:hypothetical protein [Candidatus Sabulitectum sp.]
MLDQAQNGGLGRSLRMVAAPGLVAVLLDIFRTAEWYALDSYVVKTHPFLHHLATSSFLLLM